jgi:hypothetical protein
VQPIHGLDFGKYSGFIWSLCKQQRWSRSFERCLRVILQDPRRHSSRIGCRKRRSVSYNSASVYYGATPRSGMLTHTRQANSETQARWFGISEHRSEGGSHSLSEAACICFFLSLVYYCQLSPNLYSAENNDLNFQ